MKARASAAALHDDETEGPRWIVDLYERAGREANPLQ